MKTPDLVEHFFRHEYGRLVALLVARAGIARIEDIEDAVQGALLTALERWPYHGPPDNPSAWLYQVARNRLLDHIRTQSRRHTLLEAHPEAVTPPPLDAQLPSDFPAFGDEILRLLLLCADPRIPPESQLVLALKTLCGFEVREIALRLFTTEANTYKRLTRARQRLRALAPDLDALTLADGTSRLSAVHHVLYLLFTEGHHSVRSDATIRHELCADAIRLTTLLAEHPVGATPETAALLALFHLNAARLDAREDATGGLLLLEEQDRTRWNQTHLRHGLHWLNSSAHGDTFSRYHAEAAIAAEHATAPNFASTRWDRIAATYAQLDTIAPSPLHTLNRALAVAEWQSPAAGLEILQKLDAPSWLLSSYLWAAAHADLHRRCGHAAAAQRFTDLALQTAPTPATRTLLQRRLQVQ